MEQIRVGWNRRRRSTDPVNLLYPFEVDRIMVREPKKLSSASTASVQFCSAVRPLALRGARWWSPSAAQCRRIDAASRSEEHTSELQSLMRTAYAVLCLKKNNNHIQCT